MWCTRCVCAILQVWVKPTSEMQFLYGNNVLKSGLARITEATPAYTGVVVYNMNDIPLGFGVTAKATNECRAMDPSGIVAFHQGDVGRFEVVGRSHLIFKPMFHLRVSCALTTWLRCEIP